MHITSHLPYHRSLHFFGVGIFCLMMFIYPTPVSANATNTPKHAKKKDSFCFRDEASLTTGRPRKLWTEKEKKHFLELIDEIRLKYPGILKLVTSAGPIPVLRSAEYPVMGVFGEKHYAAAETAEGQLYINDRFFQIREQKRALIHELAHLSDSGCYFSLSPAFLSSFQETMQDARLDLVKDSLLARRIPWFSKCEWLSYQGCTNVREVFAEYVESNLELLSRESPARRSVFLKHLLKPSHRDMNFLKHFARGERAYADKSYMDAIAEFQNALILSPSSSTSHINLARCWNQLNDFQKAEAEIQIAIDQLNKLNLSVSDSTYWRVRFFQASVKCSLGKNFDALEIMDELRLVHVYDFEIFRFSAKCNEQMGNLRSALVDWYLFYFFQANPEILASDWIDFRNDAQLLRKMIAEAKSDLSIKPCKLCHVLVGLYRANTDDEIRDQLVLDAIALTNKNHSSFSSAERHLRIAFLSSLFSPKTTPLQIDASTNQEARELDLEFEIVRFLCSNTSDQGKYERIRQRIACSSLRGKTLIF